MEESWLPLVPLVWVGPKLIIPDKEYASLEMGLRTLELVLASKNCLAAWLPRALLGCQGIATHHRDTY